MCRWSCVSPLRLPPFRVTGVLALEICGRLTEYEERELIDMATLLRPHLCTWLSMLVVIPDA